MKIIIDYESSWRNSFLDGNNNEELPKNGRNYIASMTQLKKKENFIPREVTIDTVMGVLNRLIGDQRKLYQTRANYKGQANYFADIENSISFEDQPSSINQETVYLRNIKGSTDQNSFTGMIRVNDPTFQSDYSPLFWGVLWLETSVLFDFILNDGHTPSKLSLSPTSIMNKLEEIKKLKPIGNESKAKEAAQYLQNRFDKYNPLNKKGKINMLSMYCSTLYLQLERLSDKFDMETAKSKQGGITGISNNGFTPKDFMSKYTTGPKKIIYGNPYVQEEFIKGEGKIKNFLTKSSGQLKVHLDINLEKAKQLKYMIDAAGVTAFYLGKKGLAYVSQIEVR